MNNYALKLQKNARGKGISMMGAFCLLAFAVPSNSAFAAGTQDTAPPKATQTTQECENDEATNKAMIWEEKEEKCVIAEEQSLNDDTRYKAVRELAYAGEYKNALQVLAAMSNQKESRVLNYYGFINRKLGNTQEAFSYYKKAIAADPNNILARSYMGQGYVSEGMVYNAKMQLGEINARSGTQSWAYTSLAKAIETGKTSSY